jgi:pterin-4a-carbinolamine dehydratase
MSVNDDAGPEGLTPATFHRQPGVSDWRVTNWGAQAVFLSSSLAQGARFLPAIVAAAERTAIEPDVDLRAEAVIVRVHTRGAERIPARAAEFAAEVSRAAADLALTPDVSSIQCVDIYVAQHSATDTRPFWTAALGYDPLGETDAFDPLRRGPQLAFNPIRGDRQGRGRTHIDVSVPADQAQARVAAVLAAGGRLVDDGHAPAWWTVASPDGHGIDIAAWMDTLE